MEFKIKNRILKTREEDLYQVNKGNYYDKNLKTEVS